MERYNWDEEPPDGIRRGIAFVSREPCETLICPGCGDVTLVTKKVLATGVILGGQAMPVCSGCGLPYQIVFQTE